MKSCGFGCGVVRIPFKGLKTKALLVKRYAQCIDFKRSLTVISYKYFFLIHFAEHRNTWKVDAIKWWLIPIRTKFTPKEKRGLWMLWWAALLRHHPAWNTQTMAGEILWKECLHSPVQKWISITNSGKKSRASNIIYSNKFKKGENFFDRPIFKRYRGN